jgi:hypothetical protein
MKRVILLMMLPLGFSLFSGMSLFRSKEAYLSSFEGKVIDADTKEPIEGAAVLAVYFGSTTSVAGSNYFSVDAQETLTDAAGGFKIASKVVQSEKASGKLRANITIFKPGYGVFPNHRRSEAVGENKSWPPPEKYIVYELPKLKTMEERKANMSFDHYLEIPYEKRKLFLGLINEERKYLGFEPYSVPKQER